MPKKKPATSAADATEYFLPFDNDTIKVLRDFGPYPRASRSAIIEHAVRWIRTYQRDMFGIRDSHGWGVPSVPPEDVVTKEFTQLYTWVLPKDLDVNTRLFIFRTITQLGAARFLPYLALYITRAGQNLRSFKTQVERKIAVQPVPPKTEQMTDHYRPVTYDLTATHDLRSGIVDRPQEPTHAQPPEDPDLGAETGHLQPV